MGSISYDVARRTLRTAHSFPLLVIRYRVASHDARNAKIFFKTNDAATKYTLQDLEDKHIRRNLVQQMSVATSQLPGSVGERRKMRQELEGMVHQIEAETADLGYNNGAGIIPAGFCTLTCPVYKWQQLFHTVLKAYPSGDPTDPAAREYYLKWQELSPGSAREAMMKNSFYLLALTNPAGVAWYCALKLELAVHLVQRLLTDVMQSSSAPGFEAVQELIRKELQEQVGEGIALDQLPDIIRMGSVDDFYASFEWSSGGLIHVHMALWIIGAPRLDKITAPRDLGNNEIEVTVIDDDLEDKHPTMPKEEAVSLFATFWESRSH